MLHSRQWPAVALILFCTTTATAGTWNFGDLISYTQSNWGGVPGTDGGATVLTASYDTVYASTFGIVTVGSLSGFTMSFTDADSVIKYLPAIAPFAPLNGSVLNPISTASGALGGEVLGLELNVDFSDAGFLPGTSGLRLGDLILTNFTPFFSPFNGLTVRQFLGDVNILLGGGSTVFTISDLGGMIGAVNASFSAGTPSTFAQDHLIAPAAATPAPEPATWITLTIAAAAFARKHLRWLALLPCVLCAHAATWNPGDLTTYGQGSWGGNPGVDSGATLLTASFNTVYGSAGGVIVGSPSGFTMVFTDAASVLVYAPSVGTFGPLTGSVVNPVSTSSGAFGGEVLGIEFNVDFSDAGLLPGTSGLRFGDLILANFTSSFSVFNGLTVRQYLEDANILLSGGSTIFSFSNLGTTASDINGSFSNGTPTTFAQDHLIAPAAATPAPEPATWMLLSIAATLFACARLRRPARLLPLVFFICILSRHAAAGTGIGPIDGPIFTGGVETSGGTDAFFGPGLRYMYCDPTATLPVDFCASLSFQTVPQPAFTASLTAYPTDFSGISHFPTDARASGEMVYFFAVVGPDRSGTIPLTISTNWESTYTPAFTNCCGTPQSESGFTFSAGVRVDAVTQIGSINSVTQSIGPGFIPGPHVINAFAVVNTQYDIALILAQMELLNSGALQAGTGPATASLLVDPIINFAPGFDSTGYSIVVSPGVGNGADATASPEPAAWLLLAPAIVLWFCGAGALAHRPAPRPACLKPIRSESLSPYVPAAPISAPPDL